MRISSHIHKKPFFSLFKIFLPPKYFGNFCVLLLFALSACSQPPTLPRLSTGDTILSFGDSLTFGTGADQDSSYPAKLAQYTGLKVVNAGKPGEVSADGAKRLPAILDDVQPRLLILCHGGNDMLRKKPLSETRGHLEQMIMEAKSRGIAVVLLGVPKPKLLSLKSAELYQELAQAHKIPIDLKIIPDVLGNNNLKSDPIHPNNKGYELIATAVHKLLLTSQAL